MNKIISLLKSIIYLCLFFSFFHCTFTSEPDFVKLDEYKITGLNKNEIKLSTNAYFHNPNDVGCEVVSTDIDVFVNGLEVSEVTQSKTIQLDAGNEFFIPLSTLIPLEKISKDKKGILGGLLTTLFNKNLKVKYEGIVTLKKMGIEFDIDIEGEEMLKEFKKI